MRKTTFIISTILLVFILGCDEDVLEKFDAPKLILSSDILVFEGNETQKLYLSTKPSSECSFQVVSFPKWVDVFPTSGTINRNVKEITITHNGIMDAAGLDSGELIIMSTLGLDTVVLKRIQGEYLSYSLPDSLVFSVFNDNEEFLIVNRGNIKLDYTITFADDFLKVHNILLGSIDVGGQEKIILDLNRDRMTTGIYESEVYFTINGEKVTIPVRIENLKEQKLTLSSDVLDVEYSKTRNLLVYITGDLLLNIYDPTSKAIEKLPLFYVPTCLSLSSNGEKAVVGHDGHVTYVDLLSKKIIRTNDVSCYAIDIVLADNEWAYVFPKQSQWDMIRCINVGVDNALESKHKGNSIHGGTKAKLHPSGKYIYGADNGLSPSDLEKYDIQNGIAQFMYDSPYHGDYSVSGDLWFSEDGRRVFTKGKTVFKTSEIKEQDLLYNGSIKLESNNSTYYSSEQISWLDHSEARKNLYILSSSGGYWDTVNTPYVYIYNSDNLTFRKKIELEKYLVKDDQGKGAVYPAEPYYVFSNSMEAEIYVVTKALHSGLVNDWAIQTIKIE